MISHRRIAVDNVVGAVNTVVRTATPLVALAKAARTLILTRQPSTIPMISPHFQNSKIVRQHMTFALAHFITRSYFQPLSLSLSRARVGVQEKPTFKV